MEPLLFLHYPEGAIDRVKAVYKQLSFLKLNAWMAFHGVSPGNADSARDAFFRSSHWVIFTHTNLNEEGIEAIAAGYHKTHRPGFLGLVYLTNLDIAYPGLAFHYSTAAESARRIKGHLDFHEDCRTLERGQTSFVHWNVPAALFVNGVFWGGDLAGIPKIKKFPARIEVFHWSRTLTSLVVDEGGWNETIQLKPSAPDQPLPPVANPSLAQIAAYAREDLAANRFAQVRDYADLLRKRVPRWEMGWLIEGLCALTLSETQRARFYFSAASVLAPDNFLVAYYRALSLAEPGDEVAGMNELTKLFDSKPLMNHCLTAALSTFPQQDPFAGPLRQNPETGAKFRAFCERLMSITSFELERLPEAPTATNGGLPLWLRGFSIAHFQRFEKAVVENLEGHHSWIFLTGDNGEGKTSLLQALAVALYEPQGAALWNPGATVNLQVCLAREDGTAITGEYHHRYGLKAYGSWLVLGYGPARLQLEPIGDLGRLDHPVRNLLNLNKGLLSIEDYLVRLQNQRNAFTLEVQASKKQQSLPEAEAIFKERVIKTNEAAIERIKTTLIKLLPRVDAIDISFDEKVEGEVRYREKDRWNSFGRLSAGHQAIVALIGDMAIRFMQDQRGRDFAQMEGLVLIDELENHLHVRRQYELPQKLSEIFPRVQFIASTHSPIPLLGAPPNSQVWRIDHDEKGNAVIQPQKMDLSRLHPNNVLSSPAFGFEGFLDRADMDKLRTEQSYKDIIESDRLDKYLRWAETHVNIPDSFFESET